MINNNKRYKKELKKIRNAAKIAKEAGLKVHAGHGMTYKSAKILSKITDIEEFNIGHFLIGDSIFIGLSNSIKKFKKLIK